MHSGRVVPLIAVAMLVSAQPLSAASRRSTRVDPIPVHAVIQRQPKISVVIGLVAFNNASKSAEKPGLTATPTNEQIVARYLDQVSRNSRGGPFDIHFDIVRGSYYQVRHWLRAGVIDGAVVSPFTYELLQEDDQRLQTPGDKRWNGVVTFPAHGRRGNGDGNEPMFCAFKDGRAVDDAEAVLKSCIRSPADCQFEFISHLSTTGFIYPLFRLTGVDGRCVTAKDCVAVKDLLPNGRFVFWHGDNAPPPKGTILRFSYAAHVFNHHGTNEPKWYPLLPDQTTFPPDVLTISCASDRIHRACNDVIDLLHNNADGALPPYKTGEDVSSGYSVPVVFQQGLFEDFKKQVGQLRDGPMSAYWTSWYVNEDYDFSAAEIVDLLRDDQILDQHSQAALVLPGGGVRGAYQAAMLDHLYDKYLLNVLPDAKQDPDPGNANRFRISSVIGTSGGALVGYLAAHRRPANDALADRWIKNGQVQIRPSQIFPWLSPLRFLSLLLALSIFGSFAAVTTPSEMERCPKCGGHRAQHSCESCGASQGAPMRLTVLFAFILLAAPALIWRLSSLNVDFKAFDAGYIYAILIVGLHAFHSTIIGGTNQVAGKTRLIARIATGVAIGGIIVSVLLAAQAMEVFADPNDGSNVGHPLLALISIVLATAMSLLLAAAGGATCSRRLALDYLKAWCTVVAFLAVGATAVLVGFHYGLATSLELTTQYWACISVASLIGTVVLILLRRFVPWFRQGMHFWIEPLGGRPFPYTRLLTLVAGGFIGIVSWLLFVAPAIYSGDSGAETFVAEVAHIRPITATTQFVAAITAPGTPLQRGAGDIGAGDYYALEGHVPASAIDPVRFLDYDPEQFLNAVSASGSPFPIYPGRVLTHGLPRGNANFIDGGFAHLVPVEGAVLLGAKQVLIVANAARSNPPRSAAIFSPLLTDAVRTFNLLFERSQMVDVRVGRDVLVATIVPTWSKDNPFLMDFRPSQIKFLVCAANHDALYGRPGHVLSWGEPQPIDPDEGI
jgi:predicted acylesterase/phospholipase RssA